MTERKTWALVTNGVLARILRDLDGLDGEEPLEIVSKADSTHLRDILSDKGGRSFSSGDKGRRSAMEPGSDPILHDMQDFARETLKVLEGHHRDGHLTRLVIFAAPKMLGILRQEMPAGLKQAVLLEKDLNLINLPEAELREAALKTLEETRT